MKKILVITLIFLSTKIAFADVTSTIQLPASFSGEVITQVTNLLGNFSSYITLIVGVLLAVVVIEILIGALHKK